MSILVSWSWVLARWAELSNSCCLNYLMVDSFPFSRGGIYFRHAGRLMEQGNRRSFLRGLFGAAGLIKTANARSVVGSASTTPDAFERGQTAFAIRENCAFFQSIQPPAAQLSNGDETGLPAYVACFTKGLPHDQLGIVDPNAYASLLQALASGQHSDFENIRRGSGMKLVNPEAAFTYEMEGADSHRLACLPAPALSSPEAAAEMVELYWQALARDIPFADYGSSPIIQKAATDLSKLSAFQGPTGGGTVTTDTIFRGPFAGCLEGPYISQFLWQPIPTLSTWIDQRYRVPVGGTDYLVDYAEWLALQSGLPPYRDYVFDSVPRYVYNGRGLAEWVHYDFLYQAYHNAALVLLNQGPESILNTNPYYSPTSPYKTSKVQTGFGTFGAPHVCGWLGRVTTSALLAAWYQKWSVHRRLRPEEFGGLVHQTLSGDVRYPISRELLNSAAMSAAFQANRTYLLPQAFPEGCPLHPSYPAGHASVAGACSVVLKAFFDENGLVTDAVVSNSDGTAVVPYTGGALTVGGEINKLVFNIAMGRNFAGIHYRSDMMAGVRLGEEIGIAKLQDLINTLTEDFAGFEFTRLDGTPVQITKQKGGPSHTPRRPAF